MSRKKIVVLTGVTRGLGRAMTEQFIAHDCIVAGCGRTEKEVAALRKQFPAPHRFDVVDVTKPALVEQWAKVLNETVGTADFLINNAAIINRNAPLWELSAEEFDRVIQVNVCGIANVIRAFVPAMVQLGTGVVVNFSSGWGRSTSPEVAPYCASKYAVEGLTQALAQELPSGMAAVPLNPGIIDTEMLRSCFGGSAGGYIKPEEWAKRAVPFILGLRASKNGQSLTVQ
ncbi:MAG: SDR family oxidoreductase [Verrucomicrobiota bacterium]|nr:SDR family oxidoreductase [Verrucomicrobiota bacterium]